MRLSFLAAACFASLASSPAHSQTVVQLPTFRVFSVFTTVVVPDRGTAYLGGVSRVASGRSSVGLPIVGRLPGVGGLARATTRASVVSNSGVTVTATIIDHHELDQQLLRRLQLFAGRLGGRTNGSIPQSACRYREKAFVRDREGSLGRDGDVGGGSTGSDSSRRATQARRASRNRENLLPHGRQTSDGCRSERCFTAAK